MSEHEESNILTYLRIKPSFTQSESIETLGHNEIVFNLPQLDAETAQQNFHFDGIIDTNATQDEVFEKVGVPAVHNLVDGFNSTIIVYGETGSGKTFTLTGETTNNEDGGIMSRAIRMLYNGFNNCSDLQLKASVSYLQLFKEKGYDLLYPAHDEGPMQELPKVSMLEDEHGVFQLTNLSVRLAETEEEALRLLSIGKNRSIFETANNMASLHSHCIFTISLEVRVIGTDKVRRSKLHMVDLAGSERVAKINSFGVLTEAKYINSSMFFFEMVIVALNEKATKGRTHIPYRNSMLTSVLRDSLGGNCKTTLIATINPEASHTEESLSTCKFAQRVSFIKNTPDPSITIRLLKEEMRSLREGTAFWKGAALKMDTQLPAELGSVEPALCSPFCDDVDPSHTLQFLKDPAAALKWFNAHCTLNASMETNKEELKEKIAEAKTTGERAIQSRCAITYLKQSLEELRRERPTHESAAAADVSSNVLDAETKADAVYHHAIEVANTSYKTDFDRLKKLKPEIEHLSKMIEKCRVMMQSQFDQWYANLQVRHRVQVVSAVFEERIKLVSKK